MNLEKKICVLIVLAVFAVSAFFYSSLPDRLVSHWNATGNPDGFLPKSIGLFLIPVLTLLLLGIFSVLPRIDPRQNIIRFQLHFDRFAVLVLLFMFYVQVLVIAWNQSIRFNLIQSLSPAFGILFFYSGILLAHAKPNWFVGIRTPWTLSNERVWNQTHQAGSTLFKASGLLSVLGVLFPMQAIWLILAPVLASTFFLVGYSFVLFRKEKHGKTLNQ